MSCGDRVCHLTITPMNPPPFTRRNFLQSASLTLSALTLPRISHAAPLPQEHLPNVRRITSGPRHHWFGYYDKLQFCPQNRFVLANQIDFEHRSPRADDLLWLGMIDTQEGNSWIPLGESSAWCWQQGCMLQWVPKSDETVVWNDRAHDRFVSRLKNVRTGEVQTLDSPIYALSNDGTQAVSTNFARLNDRRPGYGYAGIIDPHREQPAPKDSGLFLVDLQSGSEQLLMSVADALDIPFTGDERLKFDGKSQHWFNHLLFNTDDTRVWLLHRWTTGKGWATRAITVNLDGTDPYVLDPHGRTSHFVWRDPQHVMAWAWHPSHGYGFYLFKDRTDEVTPVGPEVMTHNGHNTYLPGHDNRWVLNDTYPDRQRMQHPYLYHVPTDTKVPLGHFHSPTEYQGEWRCDTHPRASRDGRTVCIDSPHQHGRQMYLIDISEIVG